MSNSLKFSDEEVCEIDISLKSEGSNHVITFQDTGPGIVEKNREKVFDLFENLGNKSQDSTGVGLATIKYLLERLNGEITIRDKPNNEKGALFQIKLPII